MSFSSWQLLTTGYSNIVSSTIVGSSSSLSNGTAEKALNYWAKYFILYVYLCDVMNEIIEQKLREVIRMCLFAQFFFLRFDCSFWTNGSEIILFVETLTIFFTYFHVTGNSSGSHDLM